MKSHETSFKFQPQHHLMMLKKTLGILFLFFSLMILSCGPRTVGMSAVDTPPESVSAQRVELAPGDMVEIKFAYSPEFNESQTIRSDGKLELLLVGEVDAAGKSPSQLRDDLTRLYAKHLAHPELAVMTRLSYQQRIYVGGAVNAPGVLEIPGRITAMEAIMQAGGFDFPGAEITNVIVIRFQDGGRRNYALNLGKTFSESSSTSFYLEPRDIIYVPKTKIASVAEWVDENIWRIIPVGISTGYIWSNDQE